MLPDDIRGLRQLLRLSRAALARFVGVAEITVVRWEAGEESSPHGLQLAVLSALRAASATHGADAVGRLVRNGLVDHGRALKTLFDLAFDNPAAPGLVKGASR